MRGPSVLKCAIKERTIIIIIIIIIIIYLDYESIQAGVEYRGLVYYENKTVALEAEARYNWELAEQEQYPLDNGFVVEACSLPASYHETNYMQFLQTRGTVRIHYIKFID